MADERFIEAEALLAIIREDTDEAWCLIGTLLPGEQRQLTRQVDKLAELCRKYEEIRAALTEGCQWFYHCPDSPIGWYQYRKSQPRGICARHALDAQAAEFVVHDPPAEVKL